MKLTKRRKRGLVLSLSWFYVFLFGIGLYNGFVNEHEEGLRGITIAAFAAFFSLIFTALVLAFFAWGVYGAVLLIDFNNKGEG